MTLRAATGLALAAGLAALLWGMAAWRMLPGGWPGLPLDPQAMALDQILLAFGLMPRGGIALVAGAALGLSGALLQAVLRNPVADPTTLGISGGAQLALVMATILAPGLLEHGRWPVAALGAALARGEYLLSLVIWNGGSLVQQDWSGVRVLGAVLALGAGLAAVLARPLRVLSLGAAGARGLGMNVAAIRLAVVAVAVLLAAAVSAELGLIGFVGLAAPALARSLGARSMGQVLALAPLVGALILSVCDGVVLTLAGATGEMFPTGALTGLIGGPLLIWLLPRLRGSTPPGTEAAEGPGLRLARPGRVLAAMALGAALLALVLVWIGRVPGGWAVLDWDSVRAFLPLRLPRLVAAGAAGALLALAGAVLQRLTANPLASPEVLGVSGGASIGYVATLYLLAAPGQGALTLGTMLGGGAALGLVAAYARRRDMPAERVLLAGIAVSSMAAAVLSAVMATGSAQSWQVLAWLSGSSGRVGPGQAATMAALAVAVLAAALVARRGLQILPLGPEIAAALGLPLVRARLGLIALAGLATGAATVLVGPVSFVGLMAPHLARRLGLARAQDHVLGAALIGAILMIAADFGARMAGFPYELPLGLFASLLGAPWLIWLMMRMRR